MKDRPRQRGYALMAILFMAAVLLVLLGTAIPRVLTVGQREREAELVFRGEQYARAVRLYYRKYGRFPTELDDLVKVNNNVRFLRKLYPDPMTPDGHWRLIRVGAGGRLTGNIVDRPPMKIPLAAPSVRTTVPPTTPPGGAELPAPQPQPPAPPEQPQTPSPQGEQPHSQTTPAAPPPWGRWPFPGGASQPGQPPQQGQAGQPPEAGRPTEGQPAERETGAQPPGVPGFPVRGKGGELIPPQSVPPGTSAMPGLPPPTASGKGGKALPGEEERPPFNPEEDRLAPQAPEERPQPETPAPTPPPAPPATAPAAGTPVSESEPQVFGAGIVGVASNSTRISIRVYRGHTQYNRWEFIYDPSAEFASFGLMPGQTQVPGMPSGKQPPGMQPTPTPPGSLFPFGPPSKR